MIGSRLLPDKKDREPRLSLNKSKRSGLPRTQMQAERNKHLRLSALEFARYLGWF
ncbi:MAG: hypothetical protein QOI77_1013 [Blastocatellia bacterium]|jgi:hypothetical protein|nr:hypothetical protein [Blastocatellia bacterium]